MKFTPVHNDSTINAACIVCLAGGIIFFISSGLGIVSPFIMQLLAVCLLTAGVFMLIRYKLTSFNYVIKPRGHSVDSENLDFEIERVQGSRVIPLARMSMDDMVLFMPIPDKKWKKVPELSKLASSLKFYSYCVNMNPENPYVIVFDNKDGTYTGMMLEPTNDMVAYIGNILKNRKAAEIF